MFSCDVLNHQIIAPVGWRGLKYKFPKIHECVYLSQDEKGQLNGFLESPITTMHIV